MALVLGPYSTVRIAHIPQEQNDPLGLKHCRHALGNRLAHALLAAQPALQVLEHFVAAAERLVAVLARHVFGGSRSAGRAPLIRSRRLSRREGHALLALLALLAADRGHEAFVAARSPHAVVELLRRTAVYRVYYLSDLNFDPKMSQ